MKTYTLLGRDGRPYQSHTPGTLGGYRRIKIYGRLDCPGALRSIAEGHYVQHRVFFADEEVAIAAGYRPCGSCFRRSTANGGQDPSRATSMDLASPSRTRTVDGPMSMRFASEQRLADGVLERQFTVGDIPGVLWTPGSASARVPLILLGHPGGLRTMYPRLRARARSSAANGFASATIELPGTGERPPVPITQRARADLRRTLERGDTVDDELIDRLILPLVEQSVPEWRATLDALLSLPEMGGPVGYSGGVISIGIRLAIVEPRIVAAGLFAGSFVPRSILDEARRMTIPVHVLLQWDDEGNDRQRALDLFDAFGSKEKTLYANPGGHTGVPQFAGEDTARFFARHLT